jgi:hypothetical protein
MRKFAWVTFLTGLSLSAVAGFYSVVGLAMIFSGAYWPVLVLAGMLEVSKLVAVSWMYRYRQFAGYLLRTYFFGAILVLMCVTSMGIFGYLTRAHVESEAGYTTAQLTLQEIQLRETQLQEEREQVNAELKALTEQSTQLVTQLGAAQRLRGTQGAVTVQRENAARRTALLADLKRINGDLTTVQKERVVTETDTNKATADIGPLRYVAQAVYGNDDVETIRKSVVWLTGILMIVFDPMAIMLLIAANILFTRLASPLVVSTTSTPDIPMPVSVDAPPANIPIENTNTPIITTHTESPHISDVPEHLIRQS